MKFLIGIFSVIAFTTLTSFAQAEPRIVGYSMNPASPNVLNHSANYITDLVWFSVEPKPDATIDTTNISDAGFEAIEKMRSQHTIRIHIAVGGWGRCKGFAEATRTPESRAKMIENLLAICKQYKLDGIDYDWEFPENDQEYAQYSALLVETKAALRPLNLELSLAVSPWQTFPPEAIEALDRFHLMAYDYNGKHSDPKRCKKTVEKFIRQGVPAEKIYMGVPFYGRSLADRNQSASYKSLVEKYTLKSKTDEIDGIYFNGPNTIADKTRFAQKKKLGGIMIWELSQDTTNEHSLIATIHDTLNPK